MELDKFIEETILQIVKGVKSSQEKAKESGALINPECAMSNGGRVYTQHRKYIDLIDFEVGLTNVDGKEEKGGIGVFFGGFGIGGSENSDVQNTSITKVKFSVPIILPQVGSEVE